MKRITGKLLLGLIILLVVGYNGWAGTSNFDASKGRCSNADTANGDCLDVELKAKAYNAPFNFTLWNTSGYTVDTVWLRARLSGQSSWIELDKFGSHINGEPLGAAFVNFWFSTSFLEGKLGTTLGTLQKNGFEVRLKIKSVGAGSGMQDKCSVASVKYVDGTNPYWKWRHKGKSTWYKMGKKDIFKYKAGGTVNAVKCAIKGIDGTKL